MKKFIKSILIFIPIALLGYSLILFLWSNLIPYDAFKKNMNYKLGSYGHLNTRLKEADTVSNIDILILGSSHAYRGFDPRIFDANEISIFVMGSSSQTPIQAVGLVKEYVPRIKPAMVIYEVYPGIFQNDGVESSLDVIANHRLNWNDVLMAFRINHLKAYNALINDLFRECFGLNNDFNEPKQTKEDLYVNNGFVEKLSFERSIDGRSNTGPYKPKDKQLKAFEEVIQYVKGQGIPILLVQVPITKALYEAKTNNDEIDSMLSSYSDYHNFNGVINLNDSIDFYDKHHLSQSGVEKFNRLFIKQFKEGFFQ